MKPIRVYLEAGSKKTFAGALDWPGWSRSGRDEDSALGVLLDYGSRYARALRGSRLGFRAPTALTEFAVIERLEGNSTTDFGAPAVATSVDTNPIGAPEFRRFLAILKASWKSFDAAVQGEYPVEGPRGGVRWSPRYFVRRVAWHALDHAWEIEDRLK